MKKLKMVILTFVASISLFCFSTQSLAASTTHIVKSGDTYWKIGNTYGVSVLDLKNSNNKTSNLLNIGQTLVIPKPVISVVDKDLMARLVFAEAKGEPYAGKVAVATVILNRLSDPNFPNTVSSVVYQIESGHYAFTPVQNGTINQAADQASKNAVNEALAFRGQGRGSVYFYNPKTASSKWIFSREVTTTIGNHRFAK